MSDEAVAPLILEVMKKAAVIWLRIGDHPARAAWAVSQSGVGYVLNDQSRSTTDTREQHIPGLDTATECTVIARSADNHAQIAQWQATVRRVEPHSDAGTANGDGPDVPKNRESSNQSAQGSEWDQIAALMLTKRLNLPDTPTAISRWRETCHIVALHPQRG